MDKFTNLYAFLEFAKNNRKYPESTANNLKSSLKIFEKALNEDELDSVELVSERIEEIFVSVINQNKDKSITSLNTYKARLQRVLDDYKKYGADPSKLQNWHTNSQLSTRVLNTKDKQDKISDKPLSDLSSPLHRGVDNVHKLELSLPSSKEKFVLLIPNTITKSDAQILKSLIESLIDKD